MCELREIFSRAVLKYQGQVPCKNTACSLRWHEMACCLCLELGLEYCCSRDRK